MNTTETTFTSSIRYDRETRDFCVTVNGECIGYRASQLAGEQLAREYIADQIEWAARCAEEAAEVAALAQPAPAPVAAPRFAPITTAAIATAVAQAREAAAEEARWVRAINRAYEELLAGRWLWDGEHLVIASRTRPGRKHRATVAACTCEAFAKGNACYHRASVRLLQRASTNASA